MEIRFVAMLVVAVGSAAVGFAVGRRSRRLAAPILALGFAVLSLSLLPRLFPSRFYFLFPGTYLGELLLPVAFCAPGVLAAAHLDTAFRIILQVILAPVMAYFVLWPAGYLAFNADSIRGLDYRVVDGVTLQSDYFGCVPSSVATVLRRYGIERTEGELALALRTTRMGTDYINIPQVVRRFGAPAGLEARFVRGTLFDLRRIGRPAVLFGYSGTTLHATALLGFSGDAVVIGDPLVGILRVPDIDFRRKTRWTGLAAVIDPDGAGTGGSTTGPDSR